MATDPTTIAYSGTASIYTVQQTGEYEIIAYGGAGGTGNTDKGGFGAEIAGDFHLTAGERLTIIVGGKGSTGGAGGGGGGTFVLDASDANAPVIIAGGGGGAGYSYLYTGINGQTTTAGAAGSNGGGGTKPYAGAGGTHGQGGGGGTDHIGAGGGGGGLFSSGGSGGIGGGQGGHGGGSFAGGAAGSYSNGYSPTAYTGGAGAYGGGGGGGAGDGGGGGGYSGGGGGGSNLPGGGGGSLDTGTFVRATVAPTLAAGEVIIEILCYLRGTRILTPNGEAFIEDLRIGDPVAIRRGGFQPIKWIGRQSFDARFARRNPDKIPVCIHAGALGPDVPIRDLYVTPGHAMLLDGVLVLAGHLVNGITITQDWAPAAIHYYHLELDQHDCVLAEGAWSETYADTLDLRASFHNAATHLASAAPAEPALCAPRPLDGPALEAALRPVAARAAAGQRPGKLDGFLEVATPTLVCGWALDTANPDLPVSLEVLLDGVVIATGLACHGRADLAQAGKGRGRCAFAVVPAPGLSADAATRLHVRRAGDGAVLALLYPAAQAAA